MFKLIWVAFCLMQPMSTNKATIYNNILLSGCDMTSLFGGY